MGKFPPGPPPPPTVTYFGLEATSPPAQLL